MDKMTNNERRRIAGIIRSIRSEIHASCKITTRELAMERLDQLADEIDAPEREYPTEGEYQRSGRDLCVKHKNGVGVRLLTFEIGVPAADRRMFEKAYEMYKHEREIVGATDTSSKFVIPNGETTHKIMKSRIDYIETGANNESS